MRIAVINPSRVGGYPVVREERYEHKDVGSVYPPLNLLYVASALEKAGYKPDFLDANGFNISFEKVCRFIDEKKPEVLIIRNGFDTQKEDFALLKYAKEKYNTITIVRNKIIGDVDWLKEETLRKYPFIDIFINYEPDMVIGDIIKHIEEDGLKNLENIKGISFLVDNKMITTTSANIEKDIDNIPFPAYHLLPNLNVYHTGVLDAPMATVATSRGCPFKCSFCAYAGMGYRFRSPENVIEELKLLKKLHNIKSLLVFDDLIGLQKGRFEKICELMIEEKLDLKWVACTRANLINDNMLKLMKKAGCVEMPIGIESGSPEVLERTHKGITLDNIREAARLLKKNKILFYGLAILGLPGETRETIEQTIKFIKEVDPFYTQFCFATPFPNTEIYNYYKENNLLLTEDWSKYTPISPVPVIRTRELSAEDLIKMRQYIYRKLVLRPAYLLKKIKPLNWKWNIEGFFKILGVIWRIITHKIIR